MLQKSKIYEIHDIGLADSGEQIFIWADGLYDERTVRFCLVDSEDADEFLRSFTPPSTENFQPIACIEIGNSFVPVPVETVRRWGKPRNK